MVFIWTKKNRWSRTLQWDFNEVIGSWSNSFATNFLIDIFTSETKLSLTGFEIKIIIIDLVNAFLRRNFRNLDRANVEATGFVGLFGQDDNDQPKTLHVPNVKRSNSCLSGKIGKVNVRNQDFKRNSKIKENVEIEKENSELDPELQKVIDAAK